ncbi:hypothetical protein HY68_12135 [Streptomyces sp. AcH 505]|uniref:DUF1996 domain-containing protein n=1 Tax=unclassified Streptomyces TaxID=2593676 RepID=UPI000591F5C4|nr:DUF1996 domain-containing protein [Streptomyces sp. NBC_00370]KIF69173.1 hypothetical protein HY68_12135 [Streptomyces sp. AcH 505]
MARRSRVFSGLLLFTAMSLTTVGVGGLAMMGSASADTPAATHAAAPAKKSDGHSGMQMAGMKMPASTQASGDDPDGDGYIMANPPVTGVTPSTYEPPHAYFHEFQAKCAPNHTLPDDPIVYPGQPGKSHDHTFMGNSLTNANTTTASIENGTTACLAPGDKSGYWMPSLFNGDQKVLPVGEQTIYYKSSVNDYTSVRPFPKGLRFVVGSPMQTKDEFKNLKGTVEGWECGTSYKNFDFPASCPTTPDTQLNLRLQAPSCWDGIHLDTPDHKAHMAYPVASGNNQNVCPADHPVALPMIEFKMAWPVNGDTSKLRLASGAGFSFHYDFFNGWDNATLNAMVTHCINGGLQCDAHGYDEAHPEKGAALNANYELP